MSLSFEITRVLLIIQGVNGKTGVCIELKIGTLCKFATVFDSLPLFADTGHTS